jgi:hypothetical protein
MGFCCSSNKKKTNDTFGDQLNDEYLGSKELKVGAGGVFGGPALYDVDFYFE